MAPAYNGMAHAHVDVALVSNDTKFESRKTKFRRRGGNASVMHRSSECSGGLSCSVHGLEAFGRTVMQCPQPQRLSLDKDDVGNL
ncbi:unnamed protein product [Spirodela intermedia]|uniref:Uncharacterized protein n=1 Tax=Spirodela intermedia TaxID=51605 RepID=A0A7I8K7Y3_SPIIN|nr:unnamed protein product [Spirodela intermedia]